MDEQVQIEQDENPVPAWIKWMWALFALWGLFYLASYWFPDLARWLATTNPDATQWQDYVPAPGEEGK